MSNTALSSARRRRAIPSIAPISQQQQQQQHQQMQQQHQRVMQQQQQQQQSVAAAPVISNGAGPYTQRPPIQGQSIPVSLLQQQQQRQVINASVKQSPPVQTPQFIKPGSVIPPGYVQTIHANGLPQIECVETGTINFPYAEPPLPPIIILRNHDKQLLQLEGQHNDIANQFAHLTSRVNHLEGGVMISSNSGQDQDQDQDQDQPPFDITLNSEFINDLTGNNLFIANVVENIMKNTNLSDMVNEIEPIKADNRELRSLVLTQQEMLNGMNSLLFKLLNRANDSACACACMCAAAQHPDTPEVVADVAVADVAVADVAEVAVADEVVAVAETIDTTPTVHAIDSEIRISVTEIDDAVYAEPAASDEIVAPVETSPSSQE